MKATTWAGTGWGGWAWRFFWLIPILLVLAAVKYLMGSRSNAPDGEKKPGALAILEERYAQGEIDRKEYLQKRDDLKLSKKLDRQSFLYDSTILKITEM